MAKSAGDVDDEASEEDGSFEALLRNVAHVSGPAQEHTRLAIGTQLAAGRLSVTRKLGEGGMGVVYEAYDAERKQPVALKTLFRLQPSDVYRLKSEFRALADVGHENLVALHELFAEGETWFFTMDLVDGERFDRYVRPEGVLDEARLRAVLPQLVSAVRAIHAAGKLHRDLKPSNVLVTRDGRARVLDFGLAVDPELGGVGQTLDDERVSGTPAYMAPEQAAGTPATAASDYYALGVMLFEALTGELPFSGRVHEMLVDKQRTTAPAVSERCPQAPSDLAALCAELLARDPSERIDGGTLHARLDQTAAQREPQRSGSAPPEREQLLGRDAELAQLHAAYATARAGTPVVCFVSGESGMGKSALLSAFSSELRASGEAVVLAGRCYERENVPYKAFDPLIDELSRYLRKLSEEAAQLLPREVFALARLFPVLARIELVSQAPAKDIADAHELQRRGFDALLELLARIRDRHPLVLCIDDLQWTDRDSTVLLRHMLAQREPSALLFVIAHRAEGAADNALLQGVRGWARDNPRHDVRELALGPLSAEAATRLALSLLPQDDRAGALAAGVAREAAGNPFFVGEMVRYLGSAGHGELAQITLDYALQSRIERLPEPARMLLATVATAGWPLPVEVAAEASGAGAPALAAVDALRTARLLRTSGDASNRRLECYHDRVRSCVLQQLSAAALRACHLRLVDTLRARPDPDPELLFAHAEGAGQHEQAALDAISAAERAFAKLAFERAARLYLRAIELGNFDRERRRALIERQGDAWMGAGRGVAAAEAYLQAADGAAPLHAIELRRRAGVRLLSAGRIDQGKALLFQVLSDLGMPLARTRFVAYLSAAWQRLRLTLRGFVFREREQSAIDPAQLVRLDSLNACATCLGWFDAVATVEYQSRHTRLALDVGEPGRIAAALAMEAVIVEALSPRSRRATALLERGAALARRGGDPRVIARVDSCRACLLFIRGEPGVLPVAERAVAALRELGMLASMEAVFVRDALMCELILRGEFKRASNLAHAMTEEAAQRDDAMSIVILSKGVEHTAWLVRDGAEEAERRLLRGRELWPASVFDNTRFFSLCAEMWLAFYCAAPERAWACLERDRAALDASGLLRLPGERMAHALARGATAAWLARRPDVAPLGYGALMQMAERDAEVAERFAPNGFESFQLALRAALALARGEPDAAAMHLRAIIEHGDERPAAMFAAAARRRLGQLLGGDEGAALLATGDAAMRAQDVADPEAMTHRLLPGCHAGSVQ